MNKPKCVPVPAVKEMLRAFQAGEISSHDLYKMTTQERKEFLNTFGSPDLADFMQSKIEKSMLDNTKKALKGIAVKKLEKTGKLEKFKQFVDKVDNIKSMAEVENKQYKGLVQDIVEASYDVTLSKEEVKTIYEKSQNLEKTYESVKDLPYPSIEYWQERRALIDYMESLTPEHELKVASSIIGRGSMLASIKSPFLNIESNIVNAITEAITKRFEMQKMSGNQKEEAQKFIKDVVEIYSKTGFDISRMTSLQDERYVLGEGVTSAQGKGTVRAIGRFYEDIVFRKLLGVPDVLFASFSFADTANLMATKLAKGNELKAKEYFNDAIRLEPKTFEGQVIREQAIADAQMSTYTNNSKFSQVALDLRKWLNEASGDYRLGDNIMPFVKTPANIVSLGLDYSGFGIVKFAVRFNEAKDLLKKGDSSLMRKISRQAIRSGLGLTLTLMLVNAIDPDDFIGEYDVLTGKEKDLTRVKGGTYNAIKVGNKYISLDFLGPLASGFVGMMYARKYGDNFVEKVWAYGQGVGSQAMKLPGLRETSELIESISKAIQEKEIGKTIKGLSATAIDFIRARTIPAIVSDVAKITDTYVRDTSGDALAKVVNSIPYLNQSLEPLINQVTGEKKERESVLSTLLFGGRVKTAEKDPVSVELVSLYENGVKPKISDVKYSVKSIKEIKDLVSKSEFTKILETFGKEYNEEALKIIKRPMYKNAEFEEKEKMINKARTKALEKAKKLAKRIQKQEE